MILNPLFIDEFERQVESQKSRIRVLEEALSEPSVGHVPRFELGNVPVSKTKRVARSPDITRKSIVSPKEIFQFRFFLQTNMKMYIQGCVTGLVIPVI